METPAPVVENFQDALARETWALYGVGALFVVMRT